MERVCEQLGVSQRRACQVITQPRATQRYSQGRDLDKDALVSRIVELATSSPSEDYLTVLAGQRQWIATTNFAGCPSRPPDSFANSAVLTTSAKFLMR